MRKCSNHSFILGLFVNALFVFVFLAAAEKYDSENDNSDTASNDSVDPARRLELLHCGLGLLVSLLVEEAAEGKAVQVVSENGSLEEGSSTDDVSRFSGSVQVCKSGEVESDFALGVTNTQSINWI